MVLPLPVAWHLLLGCIQHLYTWLYTTQTHQHACSRASQGCSACVFNTINHGFLLGQLIKLVLGGTFAVVPQLTFPKHNGAIKKHRRYY